MLGLADQDKFTSLADIVEGVISGVRPVNDYTRASFARLANHVEG